MQGVCIITNELPYHHDDENNNDNDNRDRDSGNEWMNIDDKKNVWVGRKLYHRE